MPFESKSQQRYMYAKHPRIAARWQKHTRKDKKLPERVRKKKKGKRMKKTAAFELGFAVGYKEAKTGPITAVYNLASKIPAWFRSGMTGATKQNVAQSQLGRAARPRRATGTLTPQQELQKLRALPAGQRTSEQALRMTQLEHQIARSQGRLGMGRQSVFQR